MIFMALLKKDPVYRAEQRDLKTSVVEPIGINPINTGKLVKK